MIQSINMGLLCAHGSVVLPSAPIPTSPLGINLNSPKLRGLWGLRQYQGSKYSDGKSGRKYRRKLTSEEVDKMKALHVKGLHHKEIAAVFGVSKETIRKRLDKLKKEGKK